MIPDKGSVEGVWQLKTENKETPDEQYLTLGTWLSLPDFPDGRFDAGTFANGKAKANDRLNDLKKVAATHTAEYEGPATGIYAEGDYRQATASEAGRGETPMVEHARVGSFAATASLTATFNEHRFHYTVGRSQRLQGERQRLAWQLERKPEKYRGSRCRSRCRCAVHRRYLWRGGWP